MDPDRSGQARLTSDRDAAIALSCFLAEYNWPLRVPTGSLTPLELWNSPDRVLAETMKLPKSSIAMIGRFRKRFDAVEKIGELESAQTAFVTLGEEVYPPSLAQIHDPPPVLYLRCLSNAAGYGVDCESNVSEAKARLKSFTSQPCVAIVGARAASDYGLDAAAELASGLVRAGVCVVSGMAAGIDAAAHRGSLAASGSSLAVLGSGPDIIYPKANRGLYASLVEHGLVASEYPPGTPAIAWRFPARNRIMAGLSQAVIVVEAREKSGALITADFCLEEGREVFAVPGSIFSDLSSGPHRLIRNGAAAAASAQDVLESLGLEDNRQRLLELVRGTAPAATVLTPAVSASDRVFTDEDLSRSEQKILEVLDRQPLHPDTLALRAGMDGGEAAAALVSLELRGLAAFDPARGFRRSR